jgi:hypothetical protein
MKLLTKELKTKLLKTPHSNMTPIVKFFNPAGEQTWLICYAEKYDEEGKDLVLVGYCDIGCGCVEFGPVLLSELESIKLPFGLGIERHLGWEAEKDYDYKELLKEESIIGVYH